VVFVLALIESLAIISAVLPSTRPLLAIGWLAAAGLVSLVELSLWGGTGAGLGYWLSFDIGRYHGDQIETFGFLARRPRSVSRLAISLNPPHPNSVRS
jgi:membrane protein DedA with SNARE-associated domain